MTESRDMSGLRGHRGTGVRERCERSSSRRTPWRRRLRGGGGSHSWRSAGVGGELDGSERWRPDADAQAHECLCSCTGGDADGEANTEADADADAVWCRSEVASVVSETGVGWRDRRGRGVHVTSGVQSSVTPPCAVSTESGRRCSRHIDMKVEVFTARRRSVRKR